MNITFLNNITESLHITYFNNVKNTSLTSEEELMIISEEIFKSSHELFNQVHINYQGHICSNNITDNASQRLLNISSVIFSTLTIKSLVKLFDNYELHTSQSENITEEEDLEENEFIVNLLKTNTMLHVMHFLSIKGFFKNDLRVYKNVLKEIWFHLYSRTKNVNGTSGFEHVFVGESKPRKGMIGLHNWISFSYGELSNKINYFGFGHNKEFVHKAVILETYFTYNGKRKMSTMFIGTTPELEIALYTLCFFTRPNKKCNLSFTGYKFGIQTYIMKNNDMKFVGSAFPILL
ncbi:PREDICTED: poly(U)-specific endoribonuclease homolog [Eufriesea mexicana]|uniref:poly(U)-specific endoribonuclease homolog n=1 Tax=Eufriesea mexicana TaxID=516756 RepID=UPI00083C0858|nr:PREDICTED: poly(U)-specific endoribonuclease homolog [Eufriesea mexicana]